MNPYEAPLSSDVSTPSRKIDYAAIFYAGSTYFVLAYVCARIVESVAGPQQGIWTVLSLLLLYAVIPFFVAVSYLTWRTTSSWWWLDGLVFSAIPVAVSLVGFYLEGMRGAREPFAFKLIVLAIMAIVMQFFSVPLTLITMAFNRFIISNTRPAQPLTIR